MGGRSLGFERSLQTADTGTYIYIYIYIYVRVLFSTSRIFLGLCSVLSSPFVVRLRCRARIRILHTCCRTTHLRAAHLAVHLRAARRRGSNAPWLLATPFGSPSSRTSSASLRFGGIRMQLAVSCIGSWRRSSCSRWVISSCSSRSR